MKTQELLIALLRYELCGSEPSETVQSELSNSEVLERVYKLAKKHEVIAMAAQALFDLDVNVEGELGEKLQKQLMLAKHYYECMKYEISEISRVLSEKKIEHVFLKGSVLRSFYPIPWQRTSCDVDVLVKPECLDAAQAALEEQLEYKATGRTPHDVQIATPSAVCVELQFSLLEGDVVDGVDGVINSAWDHIVPTGDGYRSEMTNEMFYCYHIIHMAKHFVRGGCGIKPFLDLWVMLYKMGIDPSKSGALLSQASMEKFDESARELMAIWLLGEPWTERARKLETYVLRGGVYGSIANRVDLQQTKSGGKRVYAISRVFPPYRLMCYSYPVLKKQKWLLPIMYIVRFFRIIFTGRLTNSIAELKYNENISEADKMKTEKFLEDIGL